MVRERVVLAAYTTLGLGGAAARFIEVSTDEQIVREIRAADRRGEPVLVLGGGSNIVVADAGFPGLVVRIVTSGIAAVPAGDRVAVSVAAGQDWDTVVDWCVRGGLSGIECLSGIPGLAGATPIQNVGAYGQEVSGTILAVRVYDRQRDAVTELSAADCGFGYRTSSLKLAAAMPAAADSTGYAGDSAVTAQTAAGQSVAGAAGRSAAGAAQQSGPDAVTGRFVVLGVTFLLARDPLSGPIRYPELARALGVAEGGRVPLTAAREAVLRLRRSKGMVLDPADPDTRSAGSFFTNPVLDLRQLASLEAAVSAACGPGIRVPRFAAGQGQVKVPAAWLIEHAGFARGYPASLQPAGAQPGSGESSGSQPGSGQPGSGESSGAQRGSGELSSAQRGSGESSSGQRGSGQPDSGGGPGQGVSGARISTKHTLALVNPGGATTASLLALAREIRNGVRDTFGVELVSEPVLVGGSL
jgi:UDP-N-acetylmuramate dehydrogenase